MDNNTMKIIVIIFGLILVTLFLILYIPVIKKIYNSKKHKTTDTYLADQALSTVQTSNKSVTLEAKSNAFISLIRNAYVLVHTMINAGNKYDDVVQMKHFKSSLTADIVKKINALEDYNG